MPQVIPRQVNGARRINGDTAVPRQGADVPRQGAAVHAPATIIDASVNAPHDGDGAHDPAAYVAQTPMVVEPDMQQSVMMRAPLLGNVTTPRPRPTVLSRQEWMTRRDSRVALLNNWPHVNSTNGGGPNQQDETTLSNWHNAQPSDEPYQNIEEIDHLGPSLEANHSAPNGNPGSDIGAVAGSSPRSPEQAD